MSAPHQLPSFWDHRYENEQFAYGKAPNEFLKEHLPEFPGETVLFPADGEGRNSVFAAEQGKIVTALDFSTKAKEKAMALARERGVSLRYVVGDIMKTAFQNTFHTLALLFFHPDKETRKQFLASYPKFVAPGGWFFLEAYLPKQAEVDTGGPKDAAFCYTKPELEEAFSSWEILHIEEKEKILEEGIYHQGKSFTIEFIARRPKS